MGVIHGMNLESWASLPCIAEAYLEISWRTHPDYHMKCRLSSKEGGKHWPEGDSRVAECGWVRAVTRLPRDDALNT